MIGSHDDERTFTVLVDELLEHLKKNREEHMAIVEEAQAKFREKAIKELDEMLADAHAGKTIRLNAGLQIPTQHVDAYDNAILTLEMTKRAHDAEQKALARNASRDNPVTDSEAMVEVTSGEIERFVRNKWGWSRDFNCSNASYTDRI